MSDIKVQGVVEMSSESAERALNRVGTVAEGMAKKVEGSADKAGKAVDNIGSGAGKSADEFTSAEGKIVSSIKRATTKLEQLGKTASQKIEMQIATKGLDASKFEPMLAKMRELEAQQVKVATSAAGIPSAYDEIVESLGGLVTAAAGLATVGAGLSKLVSVQREFDVINASLVTITDSAENAKVAFSALQQFAATTPFSLQEVAGAFVNLKSLGLDPSQRALESFGNTASAMGKSLDQFIEAVADASTGEFERLKEFGIKASQESGKVELTFRGVTTTIKNSAESITEYLTKIGEVEFAGAMAERAKTLDGAISNLADSFDNLFLTISQNNSGGFIYDSVKLASGAVEDLTKIIRAMSSAADENAKSTGAMATIQDGIGKTFETVAVLGANVAYVFKSIGTEIGGIAAQAAAVLSGDFAGALFIGDEMKRDAANARAEIDALSERLLGARGAAVSAGASLDDLAKDRKPANSPVDKEGIKAAKKEAEELKALLDTINGKSSEFDASYVKNVETLLTAYDKGKLSLSGFNEVFSRYVSMQPGAVAETAEWRKQLEKAEESVAKGRQNMYEQIRDAERQAEMYGLTASQISAIEQARLSDAIAIAEQNGASEEQIDFLKEELALRAQLTDELIKSDEKKINEQNTKALEKQKSALEELGITFTSAFENAISGGQGWSAVLKGIEQDLVRLIIRMTVTENVAKSLKSVMDSGSLGKMFSSWFSGSSQSSSEMAVGADINSAGLGGYAKGDVFVNSPSLSAYSGGVYDTPKFFQFASGAGVFAEAGPEAIMPLKRGPDGKLGVSSDGSGSVTVNVYNESGSTARTEQRSDGRGGSVIDVFIEQVKGAIAGDIASGNGAVPSAMERTYGMRRMAGAY